jgi:hypothetical protein
LNLSNYDLQALTRPVTECDTLRTKNAELERQVADLMEEVKDLKAKLVNLFFPNSLFLICLRYKRFTLS